MNRVFGVGYVGEAVVACYSKLPKGHKSMSHLNDPLVSVITACLNSKATIRPTLDSVLAQSYRNIEYIIVDGGSTDGTLDVINEYRDKISVYISEPDEGVYDAWNKAIKNCSGDWIAFLGSGDSYYPDAVQKYVDYIQVNCSSEFEYVSSKVKYHHGSETRSRVIGKPWSWNVFKRYMCVAHVGSFHSKILFEKYGFFNTEYKIAGDYELLLRSKQNLRAGYFPDVTAMMLAGGVSVTSSKVFIETFKAKVITAGRNTFMANIEKYRAYLGWNLRKILSML